MNKLDYLAQQEEQLRKLNEQLDAKQSDLLKNADEVAKKEEAPADLFANAAWTVNEPAKEEEQDPAVDEQPEAQPEQVEAEEGNEDLSQVQNYQAVLQRSRE
jgi:hypothetical protein